MGGGGVKHFIYVLHYFQLRLLLGVATFLSFGGTSATLITALQLHYIYIHNLDLWLINPCRILNSLRESAVGFKGAAYINQWAEGIGPQNQQINQPTQINNHCGHNLKNPIKQWFLGFLFFFPT